MHFTEQRDKPIYGRLERFRFNTGIQTIAFVPYMIGCMAWVFVGEDYDRMLEGMILGGAAGWLLYKLLFIVASRSLKSRVKDKCRKTFAHNLDDALFVGMMPGGEPRRYDGDLDWDVGFLAMEPGKLVYIGDRSTFELETERIKSITVGGIVINSLTHQRRVEIVWENDKGILQTVCLRIRDAYSGYHQRVRTDSLVEKLESWRESAASSSWAVAYWGLPPREYEVDGDPLNPPQWVNVGSGALGGILGTGFLLVFGEDYRAMFMGGMLAGAMGLLCYFILYRLHLMLYRRKRDAERNTHAPDKVDLGKN